MSDFIKIKIIQESNIYANEVLKKLMLCDKNSSIRKL